jgi:hypothetical protein
MTDGTKERLKLVLLAQKHLKVMIKKRIRLTSLDNKQKCMMSVTDVYVVIINSMFRNPYIIIQIVQK